MSISSVPNVRADINEMLSKIRDISNKSKVFSQPTVGTTNGFNDVFAVTKNAFQSVNDLQPTIGETNGFNNAFAVAKNAFQSVNNLQFTAETIKNDYILGNKGVSLSQVVVAAHKSKIAFEGLVVVRTKLLEAYKEIMNMPV